MSILPHPRHPNDRNRAILADFPTGSAVLQRDHIDWLEEHAVEALRRDPPAWVYIRGFASRLGSDQENMDLSNMRAHAVVGLLLSYADIDPAHITGADARGEEQSTGGERDDSARWRSVEVIITTNQQPVQRPLPQPIQYEERVVRREWQLRADMRWGLSSSPGDPPGAEPLWQFAQDMRRMLNPGPGHRIQRRRYPAHFRVNVITVTHTSTQSTLAQANSVTVSYDWGEPEPRVRLTAPGEMPFISRQGARRWISEPGHMIFGLHEPVR